MDEFYIEFLTGHSKGRLATVGSDGGPQNKPVGYQYNADLGTIDIGGSNMRRSAKYRNVDREPRVSFVIDDVVGKGAEGVRFLEIRGDAEQAGHLIRIHPRRLISWNLDPGSPGLHTANLDGTADDRPALDLGGDDAYQAAVALAAELQAGFDTRDADVSNRHFASDIMWGSPFGETVHGYDQLHAIHVRLKQIKRGGAASRFEVVSVLGPAPGVAVAQIRRVALSEDGQPVEPSGDLTGGFSEMAMYVLVRRGGTWWLAAGQNTPVLPPPGR
jgi:PPOX class F420-dependent enzyme/OxyR family protein